MHKIIISTLLITSFTFGEGSYSFLGTQTSYLNYNTTSSPSLGLKYGIQKGMWRSSFNLDHAKNGNNKLTSLIFQTDKGILKQSMEKSLFKPHVGFSFGILQHKENVSDKGYGIGLNTGVSYLLNGAFDLDLSYRYLSTTKMNKLNTLNSLTLSLHYFY
ncbi:MAG: Unknown protein [uncultured Sulfurovum sp.]|uniref:Outer membrane protein beta-barrel domain-containing protein n=1 Tax=uncultured Sulfurovum sp. TaxID=269237 RepID=A0A6S6TH02_9BACT|nr:MAG: Unknown protein [uncultured Sulfurovum sp.]